MLKILKKHYRIAASALGIIIAGCFYFASFYVSESIADNITLTMLETAHGGENKEETYQYVCYVCGEVNNPGVYNLEIDSRIYQAIEMAGGTTDNADISHLNLAQKITDGMRIYIPSYVSADNSTDTRININTATKEQLMTLTGIGESKAIAIISYREAKGGFGSIEEIMEIAGIKQAAFDKIKDSITI